MAEEDIVIRLEEDSDSTSSAAQSVSDLGKAARETTEEMIRAMRKQKADAQNRGGMGQFTPGYRNHFPTAGGRRRGGGGSSGGGDGGSGGGGGGEGPPPGVGEGDGFVRPPGRNNQRNSPFQFRIEGLMNLLKGGSNIRVRAIQQLTPERIMGMMGGLQARIQKSSALGGIGRYATPAMMGRVGGVAIGLTALAVAAKKLHSVFSAMSDSLAADVGQFSPDIAIAQANANISDMLSRMEAANEGGEAIGDITTANQSITNELRELKVHIINIMSPVITFIAYIAAAILSFINMILSAIRELIKLTEVVTGPIIALWEFFMGKPEEEEQEKERAFNRRILDGLRESVEMNFPTPKE